ncbi:unnamed protein product, partial [Phaeothamnion confervicola]
RCASTAPSTSTARALSTRESFALARCVCLRCPSFPAAASHGHRRKGKERRCSCIDLARSFPATECTHCSKIGLLIFFCVKHESISSGLRGAGARRRHAPAWAGRRRMLRRSGDRKHPRLV